MATITEYQPNCVATIIFTNDSFNPPEPKVWVCRNKQAMDAALTRLKTMKHITILQAGASHVEG
jgi:hypothetical protein